MKDLIDVHLAGIGSLGRDRWLELEVESGYLPTWRPGLKTQ